MDLEKFLSFDVKKVGQGYIWKCSANVSKEGVANNANELRAAFSEQIFDEAFKKSSDGNVSLDIYRREKDARTENKIKQMEDLFMASLLSKDKFYFLEDNGNRIFIGDVAIFFSKLFGISYKTQDEIPYLRITDPDHYIISNHLCGVVDMCSFAYIERDILQNAGHKYRGICLIIEQARQYILQRREIIKRQEEKKKNQKK